MPREYEQYIGAAEPLEARFQIDDRTEFRTGFIEITYLQIAEREDI